MRSTRPAPGTSFLFFLLVSFGIITGAWGTEVSIQDRQLRVNGQPFVVKGVNYSPVPIGVDPDVGMPFGDYFTAEYGAIADRDLPLLRAMGANTIRTLRWNPLADHTTFLDKAYNNGTNPIYIIPTFNLNPALYPDISSPAAIDQIRADFVTLVRSLKDHPAILMWSIGNNLGAPGMYGELLNDLFHLVNELARVAHQEEGSGFHPVTACLHQTNALNIIQTSDVYTPDLDLWSINRPGGRSFGNLFNDFDLLTEKPLFITEFGIDAYDHRNNAEYEDIGLSYQALHAQDLWNEVLTNTAICMGGLLESYSDEWWRGRLATGPGCPDPDPGVQSECGYPDADHPDGYADEEWWGIMRPGINLPGPDILEPRDIYHALKTQWAPKKLGDPLCPSSLSFGQTVSCSIDVAEETDTFTFSATAGDRIVIIMAVPSGDLDPDIQVYGPTGTLVCASVNPFPEVAAVYDCALPATGQYTIQARDNGGTDLGSYGLSLQRLNNPGNVTPITFGQTVSGSAEIPGKMIAYTFSGQAGERVMINMTGTTDSFYSEFGLYDTTGKRLSCSGYFGFGISFEINNCSLPATGNYMILAQAYRNSQTGDFSIYLQRLNNPVNATGLDFGQLVSGAITLSGEMDAYTFSAKSNDRVLIRITHISGGSPWVRIYRPDGILLCSSGYGGAMPPEINNCIIPQNGTYTILVNSGGYSTTGIYNFNLQRLNNPENYSPISLGATVTGTIDAAMEMKLFTFSGTAQESLLIAMSTISGTLAPLIRLYDPTGVKVCEAYQGFPGVAEIKDCILPTSGLYTLIAGSLGGTETGGFTLSLKKPVSGTLAVSPTYGLATSGYPGGPFSPGPSVYTLKNGGERSLTWSAAKSQTWLGLSSSVGTLTGGASTNVTVSLSAGADSLPPGTYNDTITFINDTDGSGNTTRDVVLVVHDSGIPQLLPLNSSSIFSIQTDGAVYYETSVAPGAPHLFFLLKKEKAWQGTMTIFKDDSLVMSRTGAPDLSIHLPNPEPGTYQTRITGGGAGTISVLSSLPELPLGQWRVGTIVRPAGSAWYQLTVPPGQSQLQIAVEAVGIASRLEIYSGILGNNRIGSTQGYKMNLQITDPSTGAYYLHLTDSATIYGSDQRRDHLIIADVKPLPPSPGINPAITGFSPSRGGNAGRVTLAIEGVNLDPAGRVTLSKIGENEITALSVTGTEDRRNLRAVFDLTGISSGNWTLALRLPSGQTIQAPGLFWIEEGGSPAINVELIGRDQIREGRDSVYVVKIQNQGIVDATDLVLGLEIPSGLTLLQVVAENGDIWWDRSAIQGYIDEGRRLFSEDWAVIPETAIQDFFRKSSMLFIPFLRAGETLQLKLILKTDPAQNGSLRAVPVVVAAFVVHLTKSLGMSLVKHFIGQTFKVLTDEQDQTFWEAAWEVMRDSARRTVDEYHPLNLRTWFEEGMFKLFEDIVNPSSRDLFLTVFSQRIHDLGVPYLKAMENGNLLKTVLNNMKFTAQNIKLFQNSIYILDVAIEIHKKVPLAAREQGMEPIRRVKLIIPVTSASPEDKYGPTGFDPEGTSPQDKKRFIPGNQPLAYKIDFWNKESSPAPTQDVFITDQLDPNLDWNSLSLTEIGFLKWKVSLEGGPYFNVDVDLRPDYNLVVNVEGTHDPQTGQVRWEFHSLDPLTRQPPEDPMAGFLPPITNTGYEIGWVNYTVNPKSALTTGSQIRNQSWVKFDFDIYKPAPPNPDSEIPGLGPYLNTIDAGKPSSQVNPLAAVQKRTNFPVTWAGSDDDGGSGIRHYTIYVSNNGGPFQPWITTSLTSGFFPGQGGHTYSFYSIATDNVGNTEITPLGDQASTLVEYNILLPLIIKN